MIGLIINILHGCIAIDNAHFEVAPDIIGIETGNISGYIMHTPQTNIRYGPCKFTLFRERGDKSKRVNYYQALMEKGTKRRCKMT